ncbi:hypothetical protein FALBO_14807 [Fusarium albosuccineum]|uniref:Uncharacterized protein n=1 Tax=Fusarium albosuccineum TaxID=1237068 RepID=A0A8H4KZV3_9HYPO|nr:hypothetical protein FALBO_14807 [Fusarium albosuccineum]
MSCVQSPRAAFSIFCTVSETIGLRSGNIVNIVVGYTDRDTPALSRMQNSMAARHDQNTARPRHREEGSLCDVLRKHAGISLFVRPLKWTDLHSRLLKVGWEKLADCNQPAPNLPPGSAPSPGHTHSSPTILRLTKALTTTLRPDSHSLGVQMATKIVLGILWPKVFSKPQFSPRFHLSFGGRVYKNAVKAQILWKFASGETETSRSSLKTPSSRPTETCDTPAKSTTVPGRAGLPMLCYIEENWISTERCKRFTIPRNQSKPILERRRLKLKKLVPSDANQDAYLVGVFLGMAQQHFYPSSSSSDEPEQHEDPLPEFQDVKLRILTHDTQAGVFILYTTKVTRAFLEKFYFPSKAPPSNDNSAFELKIEYTRVPVWPILGLRERFGKALGQGVVGEFDPEQMESWEKDPNDGQQPPFEFDSGNQPIRVSISSVKKRLFEQARNCSPQKRQRTSYGMATPGT